MATYLIARKMINIIAYPRHTHINDVFTIIAKRMKTLCDVVIKYYDNYQDTYYFMLYNFMDT